MHESRDQKLSAVQVTDTRMYHTPLSLLWSLEVDTEPEAVKWIAEAELVLTPSSMTQCLAAGSAEISTLSLLPPCWEIRFCFRSINTKERREIQNQATSLDMYQSISIHTEQAGTKHTQQGAGSASFLINSSVLGKRFMQLILQLCGLPRKQRSD